MNASRISLTLEMKRERLEADIAENAEGCRGRSGCARIANTRRVTSSYEWYLALEWNVPLALTQVVSSVYLVTKMSQLIYPALYLLNTAHLIFSAIFSRSAHG